MDFVLDKIDKYVKTYVTDNSCVFKACYDNADNSKWLIIMKKTHTTITNESRPGIIHAKYALYLAKNLFVVKIMNIDNPEHDRNSITINDSTGLIDETYRVGHYVETSDGSKKSDVNDKNSHAESESIYYFKTIAVAYYQDITIPPNYSGKWFKWHSKGQIYMKCTYTDGVKDGEWTIFFANGFKKKICRYENGIRSGEWISWYDDGHIRSKMNYLNGDLHGSCTNWSRQGIVRLECYYLNGKKNGRWKQRYYNGNLEFEGNFIDNVRSGKWYEWYVSGSKRSETFYVDGKKCGEHIVWNNNGEVAVVKVYIVDIESK